MKVLQITTRGLKSLRSNLTINFCNTSVIDGVKNIKKIKGIYGNNGAGKSALMSSIYIYSKFCNQRNYLFNDRVQDRLSKLINSEINEFYFEVIFCSKESKKGNVYKHTIFLAKDKIDKTYYLEYERFELLADRSINGKYKSIFVNKKGEIELDENSSSSIFVKELAKNYSHLKNGGSIINSFIPTLITMDRKTPVNRFLDEKINPFISLFGFIISLKVFLLDEDKHETNLIDQLNIENLLEKIKSNKPIKEDDINRIKDVVAKDKYVDIVPRAFLKNYEIKLLLQQEFIKIFKPELIKLSYEKKNDGGVFKCRKQFYYKNGLPVDIEYESSGIKHLLYLHEYIQSCISGGIVFIDELDVNLNSVYLRKLIDFIVTYSKGQLCFTSHNLELMNALNNTKSSINVIGYDLNVDSWTKQGNRSPIAYYEDGYYEHSPINVEDFDFVKAFKIGDDDE